MYIYVYIHLKKHIFACVFFSSTIHFSFHIILIHTRHFLFCVNIEALLVTGEKSEEKMWIEKSPSSHNHIYTKIDDLRKLLYSIFAFITANIHWHPQRFCSCLFVLLWWTYTNLIFFSSFCHTKKKCFSIQIYFAFSVTAEENSYF